MHNDPAALRRAFGSYMTGVTIVSTADNNALPVGFTANSFTSVSMNPPMILVCPGNHLNSYELFNSVSHFAVSVLAEGQEQIANNFASKREERFSGTKWHTDQYGSPLIEDVCATFSCSVHQRHIAGDHTVLIGEVLQFEQFDRNGLGYGNNGYFSLSKEQQSDRPSRNDITGITGIIVSYQNQLLVVKNEKGLTLPTFEQTETHGARSALTQQINQLNPDISIGPVYSIYDDNLQLRRYTFFLASAPDNSLQSIGEFIPIESLNTNEFYDKAQSIMVERFITEVRNKLFGLYVGDYDAGDIHHPGI